MTEPGGDVSRRSRWADLRKGLVGLRRRELVAVYLFVFVSDTIIGTINPTLSLFARSLGASLTLVGTLATLFGLTRLGANLVVGTISDRRGRKGILMAAMFFFALAALLYSVVTRAYLLIPIYIVLGLGFTSGLTVALAYIADLASERRRSLAFGVATTLMGLGYSLGSLVGGRVAATWGYRTTYRVALVMALVGFLIAWRGVPRRPRQAGAAGPNLLTLRHQLGTLLADPIVLAVSVGTVLNSLVFGGLVVTFFPLYANSLGIGQGMIGSIFATRALVSTLIRLPAGALTTVFAGHRVVLAALLISMTVAFTMPQVSHPVALTLCLIGEGIAFGVFLTSGQSTIASRAGDANRGAVLGIYWAAASLGDSVMPLFLGIIADAFGIRSVFYVIGGLVALGVGVIGLLTRRSRQRKEPLHAGP